MAKTTPLVQKCGNVFLISSYGTVYSQRAAQLNASDHPITLDEHIIILLCEHYVASGDDSTTQQEDRA